VAGTACRWPRHGEWGGRSREEANGEFAAQGRHRCGEGEHPDGNAKIGQEDVLAEAPAVPGSEAYSERDDQAGGRKRGNCEPEEQKGCAPDPSHTRIERTRICRRNGTGIDGRGGNLAGTAASFAGEPQIDNSDDRAARPRL